MALLSDTLKPPLPEPLAVQETDLVALDDYKRIRDQVFTKVMAAAQQAFPVSNDRYTLQVKDLAYTGPEHFSKAEHKKAILNSRTLARKLTGKYELIDKSTGAVVAQSNRKTLMNVPYLTDYGTFVRDGVEYGVPKQFRMRPGIYGLQAADGSYQAQFNARAHTGQSFRMFMDPQSARFYFTIGGRKVPAYPVLQAMGVTPEQMQTSWGKEVYSANANAQIPAHTSAWIEDMIQRQHTAAIRNLPVTVEDVPDTDAGYEQEEG